MKTAEEWQRDYEYADPQMVRDIQRDAFEAGAKAQMEVCRKTLSWDGLSSRLDDVTPAPFPGETK